jgi:dynein intermediate chain 1
MCIDLHPSHPALIAAGCYDGTVMVFDIRLKSTNKPIYQSTVRTHKHTDPVWQVKWQKNLKGELSFYSISSDGRVTNWNLMKNKLEAEEVIKLKLVQDTEKDQIDGKKEAAIYGLAGGMCFDFNPFKEHLFLVGTEEGMIHLCSKAYSGQYQETFKDHNLAVYAVKWNPFHEDVFLSCSADWTIKMWHLSMPKRPVVTFDLDNEIGDIAWAPYSSTVFAAVTSTANQEGRLYIYDLD